MNAVTVAEKPSALPSLPGSYVLAIDVRKPIFLRLRGRAPLELDPGRYFYAGSAKGPGGIRARVGRHVKKAKSIRWHIDRLTNKAVVAQVLAVPGGDECDLLRGLLGFGGVSVPVPGFGASDCVSCPAHLVKGDGGLDLGAMAKGIAQAMIWRRLSA